MKSGKKIKTRSGKTRFSDNKSRINWYHIALFLASLLLYANTIGHGFNLDDELVTQNHPLCSKGLTAIPEIFSSPYYEDEAGNSYGYRPVTLTSFAIEYSLFGDSPLSGHLINVILYAFCIIGVFTFIAGLGGTLLFSLSVSVLFMVHPIHTEVVASIKNRDELLAFLFAIYSLVSLNSYYREKKWTYYLLSLVLILMALLSKLSALPITFLAASYIVLFKENRLKIAAVHSLPFILIAVFLAPYNGILQKLQLFAVFFTVPLFVFALKNRRFVSSRMLEMGKMVLTFTKVASTKFFSQFKRVCSVLFRTVYSFSPLLPLYPVLLAGFAVMLYQPNQITVFLCVIISIFPLFYEKSKGIRIFWTTWLLFSTCFIQYTFEVESMGILLVFLSILFHPRIGLSMHAMTLIIGIVLLASYIFIQPLVSEILIAVALGAGLFTLIQHQKLRYAALVILTLAVVGNVIEGNYLAACTSLWVLTVVGYELFKSALSRRQLLAVSSVVWLCICIDLTVNFTPASPDLSAILPADEFQPDDPSIVAPAHDTVNIVVPDALAGIVPAVGRKIDFVENPLVGMNAYERAPTAFAVMLKYLQLGLVPHKLLFYYGYDEVPIYKDWGLIPLLGVFIMSIALVLIIFFSASRPLLSFSLLWLVIYLGYYSNLGIIVAGVIGDRHLFFTSLGLVMLLVWLVFSALKIEKVFGGTDALILNSKKVKKIAPVIALVTVVFASLTLLRSPLWADPITLFKHDLEQSGKSAVGHHLLGTHAVLEAMDATEAHQKRDLVTLSVRHFKEAVRIYPNYPKGYFDLGRAQLLANNKPEALKAFVQSAARDSSFAKASMNAALLAQELGAKKDAEKYYLQCINRDSSYIEAYTNLSFLYFQENRFSESVQINRRAAGAIPESYLPYLNIGKTFYQLNQRDSALHYFKRAQQLNSTDLQLNRMIESL